MTTPLKYPHVICVPFLIIARVCGYYILFIGRGAFELLPLFNYCKWGWEYPSPSFGVDIGFEPWELTRPARGQLCLASCRMATLFSRVATPVFLPSGSTQAFQSVHMLWLLLLSVLFYWRHSSGSDVVFPCNAAKLCKGPREWIFPALWVTLCHWGMNTAWLACK